MPVTTEKPMNKLQAIAAKYGIDPIKLGARMKERAKVKAQEGLIVDLDIGKWSAQAKLKEEDIGISMTEEERKAISLGHQKLFPPELVNAAAQAESQGRANLEKYSFLCEEGRFVPVTAWEEWKAKNEEHKAKFFAVRDEMVARYDEIVVAMKADFQSRAKHTYERMEALKQAPKEPKAVWVAAYASALAGRIPAKGDVAERFYWSEKFKFLRMPSEIEEEFLRQEKIRQERQLATYEADDKKRKISEMNDLVLRQLKEEKEKAVKSQAEFFQQTMLQQRKAILECTSAALGAIARNRGKVLGSTTKALKNLIEKTRALNFYEDGEIDKALQDLETHLKKSTWARSDRKFADSIGSIKAMMEKSVRCLENEATREEELCRIVGADLIESVRQVE
jgi:hypothetical protein